MIHAPLLSLALALAAAPAPAPADDPPPPDARAILGTWLLVEAEQDGMKIPADALTDQTMTFAEKTYAVKFKDRAIEEGTYTLDPAKDPRTIDLKIVKAAPSPGGLNTPGKTQLGIYRLDGNTLRVVFAKPGATERPRSFDGDPAPETFRVRLKRQPRE